MKKKTKKIIWVIVILVLAIILALPKIFNSKEILEVNSETILFSGYSSSGSSYTQENYCDQECQKSSCINEEELLDEIKNYKICLCCINFKYSENEKDGERIWEVKDYKIQISYMKNKKEVIKPFFISDLSTKIPLPDYKRRYLSISPIYSKSYFYEGSYPEKINLNYHTLKVDYRKLLEFITSQS